MTDTTVTLYPTTPAAVAAAILDKIEQYPEMLDMDTWVNFESDAETLPAGTAPACGTSLCAAGWAAHVTGWTLRYDSSRPRKATRGEDGDDRLTASEIYAQKGDERRMIADVAADALGLTPGKTTFWYDEADVAMSRLREIAGR
ncbi:hypothetical protein KMT30_05855 [Streptomyces sp. IBSBF 2953]|nr:hypothetical protein [Streptomyces hayashii]